MAVARGHLSVVENFPDALPEDSLPYDPDILNYATIGTSEASRHGASRVVVRPDIGLLGVIEGQGEDAADSARLVEEEMMRHVPREMADDPTSPASALFKAVNRTLEKGGWLDRTKQLGVSAVFAVVHQDANNDAFVSGRNMGPGRGFIVSDGDTEHPVKQLAFGKVRVGLDGNFAADTEDDASVARTEKLRPGDRIVLATASTADVLLVGETAADSAATPEAPSAGKLYDKLHANLEAARLQTLGISRQAFEAARRESDPQRSADILRQSGRENAAVLVARMPESSAAYARETAIVDDTPVGGVAAGGAAIAGGLAAPVAQPTITAEQAGQATTTVPAAKVGRFRLLRTIREQYRTANDAPGEMSKFGVAGIAATGFLRKLGERRHDRWVERRMKHPIFDDGNWTEESRRKELNERYGGRKWGTMAKFLLAVLVYKAVADPGHAEWLNIFGKDNDHGLDLLGWPFDHGDQHQGDRRGFDGDMWNRDPSMLMNDDKFVPDPNDIPKNDNFDIIPIADGDGVQIGGKPIFGFSISQVPDLDKNNNGIPDFFEPGNQGRPDPNADLNHNGIPDRLETSNRPDHSLGEPGAGTGGQPNGQPVGEEARLRVLASQPFDAENGTNAIKEIDELFDRLGKPISSDQANQFYYGMPDSVRSTSINLPGHGGPDMYPGSTAGDWRISAPDTNATLSPVAVDYLVDDAQSLN